MGHCPETNMSVLSYLFNTNILLNPKFNLITTPLIILDIMLV